MTRDHRVLAIAEPAEIPGDLGPYRFERRLGSGGMGEVFLAYDRQLDRHVAIKRLRSDLDSASARERLRREARAAARLNHPAIVQVHDLIETDTGDWIVMELVDGPRLAAGVLLLAGAITAVLAIVRLLPEGAGRQAPALSADASHPFPAAARPLSASEARAMEAEAWAALDRYDLPGRTDRAVALFQRLVENDLGSASAHAGLARAYWRKLGEDGGDAMWLDQALAVARHAVELDGKLPVARVSLGFVLLKAGRHAEARAELERARTLDPGTADGQPVTGERLFEPGEIERGVVLLLASRVVLLLHRLDPYVDPALPRFGLVGEHPAMVALRNSLRQAPARRVLRPGPRRHAVSGRGRRDAGRGADAPPALSGDRRDPACR